MGGRVNPNINFGMVRNSKMLSGFEAGHLEVSGRWLGLWQETHNESHT